MYKGDMLHISEDIILVKRGEGNIFLGECARGVSSKQLCNSGRGGVVWGFLGSLGRALDFEDELGIQFSS